MKSKKWLDIEEALGIIWNFQDKKENDYSRLQKTLHDGVSENIMQDLLEQKLITVEGEKIVLTAEGGDVGRDVTRRHRLAERLLTDIIEIKGEENERTACDFEHIISSDVADSICTLLGHPRVCPHGHAIPPGECCRNAEARIEAIVVPLTRLAVGGEGVIAYIVTANHPHLHKLLSMGIVPGTDMRLHQKSPSYVIKVNETQIALDSGVAGQIYVRRK